MKLYRAQAQTLSITTHGSSSSISLKNKYPTASPETTAKKTPPLNDIKANIRRYPIAELTPKSTAVANLAVRWYLGRRGMAEEEEEERDRKRRQRSSMY